MESQPEVNPYMEDCPYVIGSTGEATMETSNGPVTYQFEFPKEYGMDKMDELIKFETDDIKDFFCGCDTSAVALDEAM